LVFGGCGLDVFPRIIRRMPEAGGKRPDKRLSTGVAALDEMLGGGIPAWDSILVTGPAGSGKSARATHFVAAGLAKYSGSEEELDEWGRTSLAVVVAFPAETR
jgi:RecA/RadA recombinase